MTIDERLVCEVCGGSIAPGDAVVLGQEADGAVLTGIQDAVADGRVAMFHEEHWEDRIGPWVERDRGHATAR